MALRAVIPAEGVSDSLIGDLVMIGTEDAPTTLVLDLDRDDRFSCHGCGILTQAEGAALSKIGGRLRVICTGCAKAISGDGELTGGREHRMSYGEFRELSAPSWHG
jgi:hypothetical protein